LPILYAETWGDYWCYFLVNAWDPDTGAMFSGLTIQNALGPDWPWAVKSNRDAIGGYQGRVNAAALLPTAIMVLGLIVGFRQLLDFARNPAPGPAVSAAALLVVTVVVSSACYAWFLISYPNPETSDTVKATYILHLLPMVCGSAPTRSPRCESTCRACFAAWRPHW
jgi:hypothetical protein